MAHGIFITATGTDCGKTYVTALLVKKLAEAGFSAGYYKAALSGADSVEESDAGYVNRTAGIGQDRDMLVSYLYKNAVSPHLAAAIEGNPVSMDVIKRDFARVCGKYDYVTVEGSGGIVCPIRYDDTEKIFLEDIIKELSLDCIIVGDAGLGTINAVVTTYEYIRSRGIKVKGIILNNWTGGQMQEDNSFMITELTGIPVIAKIKPGDTEADISADYLASLYTD